MATLSRLAADTAGNVRKALAEGPYLRLLPPDDLARLMADPEVGVRAALSDHDAMLSVEQLTVLARDNSPEVRQAVARTLSVQELWQQVPVGSAETRAALIATLLDDAVDAVRFAALPGAAEILTAVHELLSLPDVAWWDRLATSKHTSLRAIAAANAATPSSTLVTLLHRLLDRALSDDDHEVVHACKEVLAARVPRAAP